MSIIALPLVPIRMLEASNGMSGLPCAGPKAAQRSLVVPDEHRQRSSQLATRARTLTQIDSSKREQRAPTSSRDGPPLLLWRREDGNAETFRFPTQRAGSQVREQVPANVGDPGSTTLAAH